jgi:hypothetical protein
MAYKVYKEFERILKAEKIGLSVDKVLEIAKTITTVSVRLPYQNKMLAQTMFLTPVHAAIQQLFSLDF